MWVPVPGGGYRHDKHPGRCLANGGDGQRYEVRTMAAPPAAPRLLPDTEQARARGWARHLTGGPVGEGRTVSEVLGGIWAELDQQDRADQLARDVTRDPIRYLGVPRRPSLVNRLLRRA